MYKYMGLAFARSSDSSSSIKGKKVRMQIVRKEDVMRVYVLVVSGVFFLFFCFFLPVYYVVGPARVKVQEEIRNNHIRKKRVIGLVKFE